MDVSSFDSKKNAMILKAGKISFIISEETDGSVGKNTCKTRFRNKKLQYKITIFNIRRKRMSAQWQNTTVVSVIFYRL